MLRKIQPKKMGNMMAESSGPKFIYPGFSIDLNHLKEAENWKVGENHTIKLQVKQTGINKDKFSNSVSFDIIGIEVLKDEKKSNIPPKDQKIAKRYASNKA